LVQRESEVRFFLFLAGGLCLLVIGSYFFSQGIEDQHKEEVVQATFPEVEIRARAAYVYDARNGQVLFAKNEDTRMPLASITKVMSALVAREISPEYGTVLVTSEALAAEGDSGLFVGERWNLKNLLDFSLITSSNDGIRAVALALGALGKANASSEEILSDFVIKMNRKAAELDLKNTYFWNETGLDESEVKGGAYGTAKDISKLMEYVITKHPEILEASRESAKVVASLDGFSHRARNTNDLAGQIPGLVASKTGFTNAAGGNLALVFDPELGRPIIITILGSTEDGRFQDAGILINAVLSYIHKQS
jgi:serine-type D-Ala-D-Ala carboxypeptidase (penicillin-binding protein 5/6)